MLEYEVSAGRLDAHGSLARCKSAEITLDTDVSGRPDAFNPAELFLAAIAACMSLPRTLPSVRELSVKTSEPKRCGSSLNSTRLTFTSSRISIAK